MTDKLDDEEFEDVNVSDAAQADAKRAAERAAIAEQVQRLVTAGRWADAQGLIAQATLAESGDPLEAVRQSLMRGKFERDGEAKALLERIRRRQSGDEKPLRTPWPSLDRALDGGFFAGMHFVVGGTGTGKTQFAMQTGLNGAKAQNIPCLYIALELGPLDLFARAIGILRPHEGRWSDYFRGRIVPSDDAVDELESLPFHYVVGSSSGWHHNELERHARAFRELYPSAPGITVVVDFTQLLEGSEREDLRERIKRAAYAGREIARDPNLNANVIMLSSVARSFYGSVDASADDLDDSAQPSNGKRTAKQKQKPWEGAAARHVGLGKESGDTEFSADTVLTMIRHPWPTPEVPREGTEISVAVAKQRSGPPGWAHLMFNGSTFRDGGTLESPPRDGDDDGDRNSWVDSEA